MGLIQTPDQLKFSYLAIVEGAKGLGLVRNFISNFEFSRVFKKKQYSVCSRSPEKFFPNLSDLQRDLCYLQIHPRLPMMTSMTKTSIQVVQCLYLLISNGNDKFLFTISDDSEEDDNAPPLPPRRSESLIKSNLHNNGLDNFSNTIPTFLKGKQRAALWASL